MLSLTTAFACHANSAIDGYTSLNLSMFADDPTYSAQCCQHFNADIVMYPRYQYWHNNGVSVAISPYLRWDTQAETMFANIREANIGYQGGQQAVTFGIGEVYWGVTEVYQPVNIVNQYDGRLALGYEDKMGQPMVHYQYWPTWGEVHLFLLPFHQVRAFREPEQRLSLGKPVSNNAVYAAGKQALDVAARLTYWHDTLDIAFSIFQGNSREPFLQETPAQYLQHYANITQLGVEAQHSKDDLLLKLEATHKWGEGRPYTTLVTGFEYAFYGFAHSNGQIGLITEYTFDNRQTKTGNWVPPTIYNNDVFVGVRWQSNSVNDTEMLLSGLVDLEKNSQLYKLSASRRLSNYLKFTVEGFWLAEMATTEPMAYLQQESYVEMAVEYYF
ncbi:malate transporter [Photobacterium makurazakiensis]|uniref:malate transporter n=1 Tax=Photobacterium makurazakiensis TaxID=2910234 RepID=UPI003D0F1A80